MSKKIQDETWIAPGYKAQDWKKDRIELINDINRDCPSLDLWEKAFNHFYGRIESRFLNPIRWILEKGENIGEGFSIVALQCILIEFLQSFYKGLIYTTKEEKDLKPFEYNSSRNLFRGFLLKHPPFSDYFTKKSEANGFYDNIRCGLLHEARTKKTWLIRIDSTRSKKIIVCDNKNMVVYRDAFYDAIKVFINAYKVEFLASKDLKINFIIKFDDLVDIKDPKILDMRCSHTKPIRDVLYFAYGSNMWKEELIGQKKINYHTASKASLKNYRFIYNKKSTIDGTAKANIQECEGEKVWGVCYEIDENDLNKLKECEKGYFCIDITIFHKNYQKNVSARTFKAKPKFIETNIVPCADYRQKILKGAQQWSLPKEYIENYLKK
jgi:gamma-glutamylcyclotransferase (GGCT)/AIG2-like uncharacterized protein YtfP